VRIANAIVVVDKIDALIPAVGELTGSGTVSSADEMDFKLAAKIASAQGIGKAGAGLLTKLNGSGGASENTTGVPQRFIGTPEDPNIPADVGGIANTMKPPKGVHLLLAAHTLFEWPKLDSLDGDGSATLEP
jgi:hypothetical protein